MFKTPILYLIFNRPDVSARTFKSIAEIKPEKLFIAADGPRLGNKEDFELCEKTRATILGLIDWPCKIETLFRDENLGCRRAVSEGISWFFTHVEAGIIIEDDCVATPDFFPYCQKMLVEYNDSLDVGMIQGTNFLGKTRCKESYFFSKYFIVWGWATWKNKWMLYKDELENWSEVRNTQWLQNIFNNKNVSRYYTLMFDKMSEGTVDTWDSNWVYALLRANQLVICPTRNLISNIGFVGTFVNKSHHHLMNLPVATLEIDNLQKSESIIHNSTLDSIQFYNSKMGRFSLKVYFRVRYKDSFILSVAYRIKNWLHL
jgi:hypothetical protein